MEEVRRLRSDYEAVVLLDRSGRLRGRAFLGLAELDLAGRQYVSARTNLEQALRAGLEPPDQKAALLLLGDLLERRLDEREQADAVHLQILHEHAGSRAAELARSRLRQPSP